MIPCLKLQAVTRKDVVMTLRNYEIILVVDAKLTDEEAGASIDKFKKLITDAGGNVKFESPWGRRRLAYEIKKVKYGIYHLFFAEANGEIIENLERQAVYDDNILKFFDCSVTDLEKAYNDFEALKENPQKNSTLVSEALGA